MAITYTQADLDALKEALVTGAEEVRIGDRIVRYRTKKDMLELIGLIQASLDSSNRTSADAVLVKPTFKKGRV